MKVNLKDGDFLREIICEDNVIWVGLSVKHICDGITIANALDCYCDLSLTEEKLNLPSGKDITLLIYSSSDADLHHTIKKHTGLRILEFSHEDTEIIATI